MKNSEKIVKRDEEFSTPQEHSRKSKQKALKMGCVACLALVCVFAVQNLTPLDVYANPGIDEHTKFVVAHACGELKVDGKTKTYLNVVEGVDQNYAHGTRMFEIDFAFSKEGELVGTHMYEHLKGYNSVKRIPFDEYNNMLICGKFHGMTSERLFELMKKYPDARFVIDTKESDQFAIYSKLIDDANAAGVDIGKSVVPFAFSERMLEKLEQKYDFDEYMFTNYRAYYTTGKIINLIKKHPKIKYVHMFVSNFAWIEINELNKMGIRVFAHMDSNSLINALNYGCTGIFSDNITEDVFNFKYKYIFDIKLENHKSDKTTSNLSVAEMLNIDFEG